jgi:hypothetical protein
MRCSHSVMPRRRRVPACAVAGPRIRRTRLLRRACARQKAANTSQHARAGGAERSSGAARWACISAPAPRRWRCAGTRRHLERHCTAELAVRHASSCRCRVTRVADHDAAPGGLRAGGRQHRIGAGWGAAASCGWPTGRKCRAVADHRPADGRHGRQRRHAGHQLPAERRSLAASRFVGRLRGRHHRHSTGAPWRAVPPVQALLAASPGSRRRCAARRSSRPSAGRRPPRGRRARQRARRRRRRPPRRPRERLALQMPVRQRGHLFEPSSLIPSFTSRLAYQRLPDWLSSRGLTFAEMASRARKIRERTVPIGQFMTSAISS